MPYESMPMCVPCWNTNNPDRQTTVPETPNTEPLRCHWCDGWTDSGLFVRTLVQ